MIKKFLLLLLGILALHEAAEACTCMESNTPLSARLVAADAVFIGKVVSVTEIPRKERIAREMEHDMVTTFRIERNYKGLHDSARLVSLNTNYKRNSCGYWVDGKPKPRAGQRWIVFGSRRDGSPQLHLTGTCDGSGVIRSKERAEFLERELSPKLSLPALALSVVENRRTYLDGPVFEYEVAIRGEDGAFTARPGDTGSTLVQGLKPGRYFVEVTLPFAARVDEAGWPYVSRVQAKILHAEAGRTVLRYKVEIKSGDYHYNEIHVFSER